MTVSTGAVSRVPLVDLSGAFEPGPRRDEVVDAVRRACEAVGFLVITGHGVPDGLMQRVDSASRRLFALPLDEKMSWVRQADNLRGYVPMGGSALALVHGEVTPPDLSELYTVSRFDDPEAAVRAGSHQGQDEGREAFFAPNVWPDPERVPDFGEALTACYAVLEDLAAKLMGLMALALDLGERWFDDKIAEHITGLAVLRYPALQEPPLPGQYRRGPHTDTY